MPPKPSVMSVAQFKYKTSPPLVRKSLSYIDNRLEYFHTHSGTDNSNNLSHLLDISKYIRAYMTSKRKKFKEGASKNLANRWGVVQELHKEVFARIQYESFMMRKTTGVKAAAASMAGPYNLERQQFEALKQQPVKKGFFSSSKPVNTNPYSMTTAKNLANQTKQDLDFDAMTLFDFTNMMDAAYLNVDSPSVYYVRTAERINKYLVVCIDKLWYQNAVLVKGFYMYALDKYGNLLVGPVTSGGRYADQSKRAILDGIRYNHSSLAAGADVICAGEMDFRNGKITEINNYSGHYAPSMQRLHDAVVCLTDEHEADLANCLLKIMDNSDTIQKVDNAVDFYSDINCAKRTT